jgi:nicotinate-nucleotide--dimethylbenzimidazole phosphoribosyltransferase
MREFDINPPSLEIIPRLQAKIDSKTKPLGALGVLEKVALNIGTIQNTLTPRLDNPTIIVFSGDHGIVSEGVSAYPQEVTYQMVNNILKGGAAICVFAKQNGINLKIVDAGVNFDFPASSNLINEKISKGTNNFLQTPAMTIIQCEEAIVKGASIIKKVRDDGCNVIGFGEMGIGNTSSASVIMSILCNIPIEECVGRGTGLDDQGLKKKTEILKKAITKHATHIDIKKPLSILSTFGGFEIAMMCGGILQAAESGMIILVDGFIATSAILVCLKINPYILDYCIFCHQSDEKAHKKMLEYLNSEPLLNLKMRLGEGSGAAVAFPLIKSAINFLNEMASFEEANVSERNDI